MKNRRDFVRNLALAGLLPAMPSLALAKNRERSFADKWSFSGVAIQEKGYHIWGASPIIDEKGKVHLFASRWPREFKVDPGWRSHSEIAHYVADRPEGPFRFSDIALKGTGRDTWDKYSPSNPTIHKVADQYVLLYIANNDYHQPPHPSNQNIGMAISNSLSGPWNKVNKNGMVLTPPSSPGYWNHKAGNGVVNPALLPYKGGFLLYFKSKDAKMGLAIAEKITGPFVQFPAPVTSNDKRIEDGYAFIYNNKVCMLTTDNDGILKKGGGLLWRSEDGINFSSYEPGFKLINEYFADPSLLKPVWHYGAKDKMKFERPQILMIEGRPAWLYVAAGCNIFGGDSTVNYVLKFNEELIQ